MATRLMVPGGEAGHIPRPGPATWPAAPANGGRGESAAVTRTMPSEMRMPADCTQAGLMISGRPSKVLQPCGFVPWPSS